MCHQQGGYYLTHFFIFTPESVNIQDLKYIQSGLKYKPIISNNM